ncbi:hypothetical protein Dimus_002990 [Dionaea muscipula]
MIQESASKSMEQGKELGLHEVRVEEEMLIGGLAVEGRVQESKGSGQLSLDLIAVVGVTPYLDAFQQGSERKEDDPASKGAAGNRDVRRGFQLSQKERREAVVSNSICFRIENCT